MNSVWRSGGGAGCPRLRKEVNRKGLPVVLVVLVFGFR